MLSSHHSPSVIALLDLAYLQCAREFGKFGKSVRFAIRPAILSHFSLLGFAALLCALICALFALFALLRAGRSLRLEQRPCVALGSSFAQQEGVCGYLAVSKSLRIDQKVSIRPTGRCCCILTPAAATF